MSMDDFGSLAQAGFMGLEVLEDYDIESVNGLTVIKVRLGESLCHTYMLTYLPSHDWFS
jgi:hypothetical protein